MAADSRETPELRLDMRLRNNRLQSLRVAAGLTGSEVARRAGISATCYCAYESLGYVGRTKKSHHPRQRNGTWAPSAVKLAEFWRCTPEDLFPETVLAVQRRKVEFELDGPTAAALCGDSVEYDALPADVKLERAQRAKALADALETITPFEKNVVLARANGETLEEVGARYGLSRERIRNVQGDGWRKIRARIDRQDRWESHGL